MKYVNISTKEILTAERLKIGSSIMAIILLGIIGAAGIAHLLDAETHAQRARREQELQNLVAQTTESSETSETSENTESTDIMAPVVAETAEASTETLAPDETSESLEESPESTTESVATTTITEATTSTGILESPTYIVVYASQSMNVRSGPGVDFGIVKTLNAGDMIDVVATTSNGWYRTYNGNYVMSSLTSSTPPVTASTTAATTAATAAQTTAAQTTAAPAGGGNSNNGMTYYGSCTITFYGPQPRGDGTYSTTTATGTTCSEGRTVAADWSIFPSGTVIYIANDPLGGDGYYTVEDRGGAVTGSHIDIYADAGESYSTTSREVYIVN